LLPAQAILLTAAEPGGEAVLFCEFRLLIGLE
jgi:hypothetical protein